MTHRREFLRLLAGTVGAAGFLAACSRAVAIPTTTTTTTTEPPTTTTTTRPPEVVEIIAREGWTDRPQGGFRHHRIERITIHHTASLLTDDRRAPRLVRRHLGWHQSHGWPDLAYHFIVDRAGVVYEGRPVDAVGDTFTSYDPTGHFLVCLEGNFDRQQPADAQLAAATHVVAWAMQRFRIPSADVTAHRDWAPTSCPGDEMYWRVAGLARSAADAGPIDLGYVRGDEARERVAAIETG